MEFEVVTEERVDVVDITDRVAQRFSDETGVCTVFVPHTTAGIVVNENESRLRSDLENTLADLVPQDGGYAHDELDDNADAHLRSTLLGSSVSIPIDRGDLALGTWQSILFVDCDGPRTRTVKVALTPGRT